jgi:hypothetical protein
MSRAMSSRMAAKRIAKTNRLPGRGGRAPASDLTQATPQSPGRIGRGP